MDIESLPAIGNSCSDPCIHSFSEESLNIEYENQNGNLKKRLITLKNMMTNLQEMLAKEKALWRKDVEEVAKLTLENQTQEDTCTCCCEEEEYNNNQQFSNTEPTLNDMSILDYEQKLSVYQQALAKAHAEKRMHLRRHLAATAYKQRLIELENMCNMELLKVKQNVQTLQPLQQMASEWSYDRENTENMDEEISGVSQTKTEQFKKKSLTTLENIGSKLNSDLKELAACISPAHSSLGTTSSINVEEEDDALMMRRLQSVGWYWYNDKNNYPINPLM